jgi:excisionase family DNA binding protein
VKGLDLEAVVNAFADLVAERVARRLGEPQRAARPMTVAEYAAARGIAQSTVRRAIREHRLDITRAGRAVRIAPDAVIRARAADRDQRAPAAGSAAMDRALRCLTGGR